MITIRYAFSSDSDRLTQITVASKRHWGYPEHWIQLWLPQLTISPEYISDHDAWIALADNVPAAWYSFVFDSGSLWLDHLWVLPDYMGQGIGRRLFQHALERCRALGFSVLKIEADPNAQSFYEKMGAYKIGEHHGEVDGRLRILPVLEVRMD